MKILYGAKMARYDLLHSCQILDCQIIKWIRICNLRLFRIVAYLHQRIELTMFGKVGENLKASRRWLYTDADSAADKSTSKSIFRCVMCHVLPYDMFPVVRGIEKAARS